MDKTLYVDVVKKNLNKQLIEKKHIIIKNNLSNRINILLEKLLKDEYTKNITKIKNIILHTTDSVEDIVESILNISNIITNTKYHTNKNHNWISNKLIEIFIKFNYNSDINIVDIGGGEGNILNFIGKSYNVSNNNLYIVEQQLDWAEKYQFNNNLNYLFWDNLTINIKDNTIDIILIIVSLHHMTDQTINNLMLNIDRILKPNGLIIIKEHNCIHKDDIKIINWEHHLYHILASKNLNEDNIKKYLENFTNNYKSMEEYNNIFAKYNFKNILNLNRAFTKYTNTDHLNATNLYWALYKKSI